MTDVLLEPEGMQTVEERKLGTAPVRNLFIRYSWVALLGMSGQIIMVILEGIIIGNGLGEIGLASVGVFMPLMLLNLALGGALGMSASALAGQALGQNNPEEARHFYGQGISLSIIMLVPISILILIFAPQVALFLGSTQEMLVTVVPLIRTFMIFYPLCILGQVFCCFLRLDEKPGYASALSIGSAVIAIAWLYMSTFVIGFGMQGAALYYAMTTGLWNVGIIYFVVSNTVFKFKWSDFKLDFSVAKRILWYGLPVFLVQAASIIYTATLNKYLGALGGERALATFAVINGYIVYILNMICLSATYGLQPIASYNYGAQKYQRLRQLIRTSMIVTTAFLALIVALLLLFKYPFCRFFSVGDEVLTADAATRLVPFIILAPFGLSAQLMSTYFQATDNEPVSILLGVCRYIIFTIPIVMIGSKIYGISGVWYSQPVADILTFALVICFIIYELKKLKRAQELQVNQL